MAHLGYRFVSAGAGLAALNGGNAVARTERYIDGSINSLSRQYHNLIALIATRRLKHRRWSGSVTHPSGRLVGNAVPIEAYRHSIWAHPVAAPVPRRSDPGEAGVWAKPAHRPARVPRHAQRRVAPPGLERCPQVPRFRSPRSVASRTALISAIRSALDALDNPTKCGSRPTADVPSGGVVAAAGAAARSADSARTKSAKSAALMRLISSSTSS